MRRTIVLLVTMVLTLLVASGLALVAGVGTATADSSVVGPGESIQKAINAAHPGDTIIVRGVHREDVIIRKDGIKLRGEDAVIEAPTRAKADSFCSRIFGPTAICVLGHFNPETDEISKRVSDVSVSGFTIRGFNDKDPFVIFVGAARNATVVGNRIKGNGANGIALDGSVDTTIANNRVISGPETAEVSILVDFSSGTKIVNNVARSYDLGMEVGENTNTTIAGNDSIGNRFGLILDNATGTKILSNDITDSTLSGMLILGSTGKVVGNHISGGAWGILLQIANGGTFAGNTIHDNCAGMMIESFGFDEPVVGLEVKGNTVENNTRSCRAAKLDRDFSGIGIALFSTKEMEVTGNHLSGNIPSGHTPVSGGVVVSTNPYDDSRGPKPTNNS